MILVAIRILLITDNLSFAIRMKQALEKMGGFEVSPFTAADTAFEHLAERPHDVALIDFNLPGMPTMDIVLRLRAIQPDIAIVLSPDLPEVAAIIRDMRLNGIVNMPCTMRELIPVIEKALRQTQDALPDTAAAPALDSDSETVLLAQVKQAMSGLGDVLVHTDRPDAEIGAETLDVDMSNAAYAEGKDGVRTIEFVLTGDVSALRYVPSSLVDEDSASVHQKLAEDEPPMPTLEENGSVSDLRAGIGDADLQEVAEAMKQDQTQQPGAKDDDHASEDENLAQIILENAADDNLESANLSLEEIINSIIRRFPEGAEIKPLPSWVEDIEQYVREPDFLDMPLDEIEQTDRASIETTLMSHLEELEQQPGDMMTDRFAGEIATPVEPVPDAEETPELFAASGDDGEELPEAGTPVEEDAVALADERVSAEETVSAVHEPVAGFTIEEESEQVQAFIPAESEKVFAPETSSLQSEGETVAEDAPLLVVEDEDPMTPTAQLALSFTQASLELTADAVLLARGGEIIAYSGNMPIEDIEDLRAGIKDDWEARPGESRIRFVTLSSSGQDYMLFSRMTEDGFTLSMIFTGNTPLRVIRRQADRLIEALQSVPEMSLEHLLREDGTEREAIQRLEEEVVAQEEAALQASTRLRHDQMVIDGAVAEDAPSVDEDEIETGVDDVVDSDGISAEIEVVEVIPVYAGPLEPRTYLWLVRDVDAPLPEQAAEAIQVGLNQQLTTMGWQVGHLQVAEDYVYLVADTPVDQAAQEIVANLKERAASIAQDVDDALNPEQLWADCYAVLTPGREMDTEEIQRFIHFGRTT